MSGYRTSSPPPGLEEINERLQKLEDSNELLKTERFQIWLRFIGKALIGLVGLSLFGASCGLLLRSCEANKVEENRRCNEICLIHDLHLLWVNDQVGWGRNSTECICGRSDMDGGTLRTFGADDGTELELEYRYPRHR